MKSTFLSDLFSFVSGVIDDPNEYLPALILAGGFLIIWSMLCLSAFFSRHRTLTKPEKKSALRFWLAAIPLLLSLFILIASSAPIYFEGAKKWQMDLKWIFILPSLLSTNALYLWWRAKRNLRPQKIT